MTPTIPQRLLGRTTGQLVNPRDDRGWMIPRPGTIRRRVYDALSNGLTRQDLGLTVRAWESHVAYIKRWGKRHQWRRVATEEGRVT